MNTLKNPRMIWNERYGRYRWRRPGYPYEAWLERWSCLFEGGQDKPVLEIGCGRGLDARYLTDMGCRVIAADYSGDALRIARQTAPAATMLQLDLRGGVPFRPATFQIIIASLCLHYFSWRQTQTIVAQLHTCLSNGDFLLARVNSTGDVNYGAMGHEAVEPNYFLVNGELKRFFDQASLERLFQTGWKILVMEEMKIMHRQTKMIWELVLEKV